MKDDNDIFVDEVMRECWEWKAQIAAEYPTWEAYYAHLREERPRLEAEGWKFGSPCAGVAEAVEDDPV